MTMRARALVRIVDCFAVLLVVNNAILGRGWLEFRVA